MAMAIRTTLNVSLSVELGNFIANEVQSGRYQTASEVVRAGLRLLQERNPGPAGPLPVRSERAPGGAAG